MLPSPTRRTNTLITATPGGIEAIGCYTFFSSVLVLATQVLQLSVLKTILWGYPVTQSAYCKCEHLNVKELTLEIPLAELQPSYERAEA